MDCSTRNLPSRVNVVDPSVHFDWYVLDRTDSLSLDDVIRQDPFECSEATEMVGRRAQQISAFWRRTQCFEWVMLTRKGEGRHLLLRLV